VGGVGDLYRGGDLYGGGDSHGGADLYGDGDPHSGEDLYGGGGRMDPHADLADDAPFDPMSRYADFR